ncbi:MAG: P4B major core protein [Hyperionvirus sp.]|uniref:P4B major core protein n=1 Tax=Hyperionvirus sp. TaxID=2487770 RepID=A0A3G5AFT5_9VIRU|nr:MAG: P4B major core protein [Hyperionvirus sp.]
MASKTYDRNINPDKEERDIKPDQFDDIIKKNVDDTQALRMIREKFGDAKVAEKVFDAYKERKNLISKKANKFKMLLLSHPKYSTLALPALLEKAKKYKKKYGLSDDEFHAFMNLAITDKSFANNVYNQPTTPMSKTLGYSIDVTHGKMTVAANEMDILQDILRSQSEHSILYEQVKIQSAIYQDCAPQAITGEYDRKKHNTFSFVHPVIAALFLPKIKYIDEHMLMASISNIVYSRYNGIPIRIQPEYELYWDLITDPNEIVCVSSRESSLVDLRNRVKLQVELWKLVLELREGRYYNEGFRMFNMALDNCKNNLFDAPDVSIVRDEGTVLRRLFGVFSLRPTIVVISTLSSGVMTANYNLGPMALSQVTTIPIVNLRLPFNFRNRNTTVYLNEALEQPDWFVENKMIVPKVKSIIYSRDIIVFYASRRFQSINFGRINAPFNFTCLPTTHSALETLNDVNVSYDSTIVVGDDRFNLRSVVFVDKSYINKDLIVGCSAGIIIRRDFSINRTDATYLLYNPQSANIRFENSEGQYVQNAPIVEIPGSTPFNEGAAPESFQKRASRRGTIYIYVKDQARACLPIS